MYHTIEFVANIRVDLERTPKQPLERIELHHGMRMRAQIRPHVIETRNGPIEATDLFFEDGTVARGVPFDCFTFAE